MPELWHRTSRETCGSFSKIMDEGERKAMAWQKKVASLKRSILPPFCPSHFSAKLI